MSITCLPYHLSSPVRLVLDSNGHADRLAIGELQVTPDDVLDCGAPVGTIAASAVLEIVGDFDRLTRGSCSTPLDAALYRASGRPELFDRYFLLTHVLDQAERASFNQQVYRVCRHPGLDLQLLGEDGEDLSEQMPDDVRFIVAAHLVELYFLRPDILEGILARPRHIRLYATPLAFAQDGGVAGGDFDPVADRMQLVLSRLYEGFFGELPGVAPFVHELGHMLDCMELNTAGGQPLPGKLPRPRRAAPNRAEREAGLLPGLRSSDGAVFSPHARTLFIEGKRLEVERYRRCRRGDNQDPPIGHPYVFQTDGEFIAGYLELFWRTPHYFADRNPILYDALVVLFGQDPRRARASDLDFYVSENRKAYTTGCEPLHDTGVTLPDV